MTTARHDGINIPVMQEPLDPDETRWLWFSWFSAVVTSEWVVPAGWQVVSELSGQTVIGDGGKPYKNCNGVLLKTTVQSGRHLVTNRCTFANGESLDRTVEVMVRTQ